ncbi:MAG: peptidase U32 family protein [Nanoarchaeota archaeon]|nr:U32 family peptidase [Nanoarchaeota archaeon]MBU4299826.1 U32 family peptidase [Nanoarchaeota archaeon]MBU4451295.1 U32 family peptidase [Nanoarchaeota archaeon]MCG2723584.1 U32 family peptidase [archaeon]
MTKVELLLPAGNENSLRAAVNNGADAVYLGMNRFNARQSAGNFNERNIASAIDYCHKRNVRVYVTFNTLVKNDELPEYFRLMNVAHSAKADALIIQDPCFVQIIKQNFPGMKIHLSTQTTTTNSASIPDGINRVVLAREISIAEIAEISKKYETECFVHGALCFSYSGQCLFSSIAGGRSGNRGMCAQPCRMKYNNKYALSTMDLCLLEKIPELINAGFSSLKVEGRMRSPLYVATVARIYRKYIEAYYGGAFSVNNKTIDKKDLEELMLAFNREFTTGFSFCDSILDSGKPMNRGIFLGTLQQGKLKLRTNLKVGDGVGIWISDKVVGCTQNKITKDGANVLEANDGDIIELDTLGAPDGSPVYKTSSVDMKFALGDEIMPINANLQKTKITLPQFENIANNDGVKIFAKCYNKTSALLSDKSGADVVYYDVQKADCSEVKKQLKNSKFFVYTPRILSDTQIIEIAEKIKEIKPEGVLVGNRGLLRFLEGYELHLDYSFNCFNDIDLNFYRGVPIISPELNFKEVSALKNKRIIVLAHGDIVIMNSRQKLKAPELVDEEGRHFRVRNNNGITEIINSKQLGLFNKARNYLDSGINYFYIDTENDADKFVRIYRKILSGEQFDDKKIKKGYTTGHFDRGVA